MKKNGFTLVELMIVVAIMAILMIIMTSIFNSTGVMNKARDAQRKKDLSRIKVAFEEYYNDKGCYPDSSKVSELNLVANCHSNIFSPWISNWPCDPNKTPYKLVVEDPRFGNCNKWYKVLTKLENTQDKSIPTGWSTMGAINVGGSYTSAMVNYGVSSSNIAWNDVWSNPECSLYGGCYYQPDPQDQPNVCNSAGTGCIGPNCYVGMCQDSCRVACCGVGCN